MGAERAELKKWVITLLRMGIGWHFLYEGFVKLAADEWTSYSYLIQTSGPFSGFYHWLASSPALVNMVDFLNVWGLILAGLALFLGLFISAGMAGALLLLLLYYFAYPPFGSSLMNNVAGQFYLIDRNLLEALTLLLLLFLREKGYGLYSFPAFRKRVGKDGREPEAGRQEVVSPESDGADFSRREALKNLVSLPLLGVMGWGATAVTRKFGVDTLSGATIRLENSDLRKLAGVLPDFCRQFPGPV